MGITIRWLCFQLPTYWNRRLPVSHLVQQHTLKGLSLASKWSYSSPIRIQNSICDRWEFRAHWVERAADMVMIWPIPVFPIVPCLTLVTSCYQATIALLQIGRVLIMQCTWYCQHIYWAKASVSEKQTTQWEDSNSLCSRMGIARFTPNYPPSYVNSAYWQTITIGSWFQVVFNQSGFLYLVARLSKKYIYIW